MDLELHQLEWRYEELRKKNPSQEARLVASLAEVGQQQPIVVVAAEGPGYVVIDGYKRLRALRRLSRDTVQATVWEMDEADALLLDRQLCQREPDALEQGWLLAELSARFGFSSEQMARRMDKSKSWVSRRLALVKDLPVSIQQKVRAGAIGAHAAMKYLVPLARANAQAAQRLAEAMGSLRPTTRQVRLLYEGWQGGTERTRELLLTTPQVYLKALEIHNEPRAARTPKQLLLDELKQMGGLARRARMRLEQGLLQQLLPGEGEEVAHLVSQAQAAAQSLFTRMQQENGHAG